MNVQATGRQTSPPDERQASLLAAVRLLSILLALAATALFVAALPAYFNHFRALNHIGSAEFQEIARANLAALGLTPTFYAGYYVFLSVLFALVCLGLALLLFRRCGHEPMGLLTAMLLVLLGTGFANPAAAWETTHPLAVRLQSLIGALSISAIILFFFLFPGGRFVPRRIRWLALATTAYLVLVALFAPNSALNPGNWPQGAYSLFLLLWIVLGVAAQIYRYRRLSNPAERRQTRLVVFGFALALSISTAVVAVQLLVPDVQPGTLAELAATTVALAGMSLIPISIGLAILRYHLFDIDLVIRRTLAYSVLTAILAGTFYLLVILSQFLFSTILQVDAPQELVTVVSTLLIAALFTPLRRRIQAFIDRRFYRPRYNARQALASFASATRDEVDLDRLIAQLLRTIDETMQPARATLWLRDVPDEGTSGGRN